MINGSIGLALLLCEHDFEDSHRCPVTIIEFDQRVVDNYGRTELVTEFGIATPVRDQLQPTY